MCLHASKRTEVQLMSAHFKCYLLLVLLLCWFCFGRLLVHPSRRARPLCGHVVYATTPACMWRLRTGICNIPAGSAYPYMNEGLRKAHLPDSKKQKKPRHTLEESRRPPCLHALQRHFPPRPSASPPPTRRSTNKTSSQAPD